MKHALFVVAASLGLARPALAQRDYDGHMMNYGGGVYMWLIIGIVVAAIVYFVFRSVGSGGREGSSGETAMDILKKRYARGEISKQEFEERKADLQR